MNTKKLVLAIAEAVREECTKQGHIPFRTGDLRKSIQVYDLPGDAASVGSVLPYAGAVHNGRRAITIRPNIEWNPPHGSRKHRDAKRARLKFKIGGRTVFAREVHQKARPPQPFITDAVDRLSSRGFGFLQPILEQELSKEMSEKIVDQITVNI